MLYTGIYTNGQSPHKYSCEVQFLPDVIVIEYMDEHKAKQTVRWQPALLHPHFKSHQHEHNFAYGDFPYQTLTVTHEQLPAQLKRLYPALPLRANTQYSFFAWNKPLLTGILLTLIGLVALAWLVLIPWVARFTLNHFPKKYEIQIGEEMYKGTIAGLQLNDDAGKQATRFLKTLIDTSEYPVQVTVVHSDEVNAFAMPGGHLVVYDGILKKMHSYEELAALLGHEYSHVMLRHSTRNILRQASISILLYTLVGDIDGLSVYVLQHAASLNNLQYSRELEHEADATGFKLMQQKQISASGMLRLFETLKKSSGAEIPAFLSTHPATDARMQFAKEMMAKQGPHVKTDTIMQQQFNLIQASIQ